MRILQIGTTDGIEYSDGMTINDALRFFANSSAGRRNADDSFFICDIGDVAKKYKHWNDIFPRCRPYFAVKSAPYEPMIRCLSAMGAGFDCASQAEIDKVLQNEISPDSIIFAQTAKPVSHILHARERGVNTMVFDSECELRKTKALFPDARLVLRLIVEDLSAMFPLGAKFGARMDECRRLIELANNMKMNIVGVCFHVGSGCNNAKIFADAIDQSKELFDYGQKFGMDFTILDIGGGFPALPNGNLSIEEIANAVNTSLERNFPIKTSKNLQIIAEPGRYFAATPFVLATNVIKKKEDTELPGVEVEYILNEGVYGSLMFLCETLPGEMFPFVPEEKRDKDRHWAWLWGPTCDSRALSKRISVPKLECGDWLFWRDSGSYTFACTTEFNGFRTRAFYNIISKENK